MLNEIKAFFFDMDDTLIHFGGSLTKKAWYHTCERMFEKYPDLSIDTKKLAEQIIKRNEEIWSDDATIKKASKDYNGVRRLVLQTAMHDVSFESEQCLEFLITEYAIIKEALVSLFPNVHNTLMQLKNNGYQLVMITNGNSEKQRGKIARFDLEKYFDTILIGGEAGVQKPDFAIYQKAMEYCNVQPNEACMVGDNYSWEVEAPSKYGLKTVWVNYEQNPIPENRTVDPDLIVRNIEEILQTLDIK